MRKNKMMRAASGLLVATLLTTSVISGTFAKYTTTATGTDSARVAKWGVKITENGQTFKKSYAKDDNSASLTTETVVSTDDKNVVAPGTKGDLVNSTITGTPEVAVKVAYEPTLTLTGWGDYCPIVFTVGTETYGLTGMKDAEGNVVKNAYTSTTELKQAVENAIKGYSKEYKAQTDLSTIDKDGYVHASWNWAFDNNDQKDTALGNADTAATVELSVKTTVTQID